MTLSPIPANSPAPVNDRDVMFSGAESGVEDLVGHGLDGLTVELVLDMLYAARELDALMYGENSGLLRD